MSVRIDFATAAKAAWEKTMETATEARKGNSTARPRGKGRIEKDHQEAALKDSVLRELKDSVLRELSTGLVQQKKVMDDEAEHYSDMVKAAAEKTGYHASTVRSVIAAMASDDFDAKKEKVVQLSLAFDALA